MSIPPRPWRALLSLGFALAVAAVPVSQVVACSCGVGETADVIRAAQLAFIGTVADQRDTGIQSEFSGDLLPAAGPSTAPEEPAEAPTDPSDAPAGSGAASPEATDLAIPLVVGGLAILLLAGAGLRGLSRRRPAPRP